MNSVEAELNEYCRACKGAFPGLTPGQVAAITAAYLDGFDRGAGALWTRLTAPGLADSDVADAVRQLKAEVTEAIANAEARAAKLAEAN